MTYCTMKIQGKKIKVGDDDSNHDNHEPTVCHDFWNEAPEDVLTEIFIRHPDCRSAVRTSTVCRRWHSLILRNSHFVERFKSHHDHHEIFPWTIMFGRTSSYRPFQTHCQIYSEEWMFLHSSSANCLDFFPSPMMIRAASCNDLLLVSPGLSCADDLYICNPVTKQFAQLPPIPRLDDASVYERAVNRCALVPMPPSGATTNSRRFKVVELLPYYEYPDSADTCTVPVSIFCSESRKWEIRNFRELWDDSISSEIITCNGILYWESSDHSERLVYFDLLEEKWGEIDIPPGDNSFERRIGIVHAGGGVHELRLIQVLPMDNSKIIHLRVWRLNTNKNRNNNNTDEDKDDGSYWILIHEKKLERPMNLSKEDHPFRGTFVHPTNGDFLFILYGKSVIEYNLMDATHKKIVELRELGYWADVTPFVMVLPSTASNLANSYL